MSHTTTKGLLVIYQHWDFLKQVSLLTIHPHQSVLLLAEDHLMMDLHVSEVLCYGKSAQAVTRVVEISGSKQTKTGVQVEPCESHLTAVCVCVCPDGVGLTC